MSFVDHQHHQHRQEAGAAGTTVGARAPAVRRHGERLPRAPGPERLAYVLFAGHVLLLFFPPIPPLVKGSIWSYLLAAGAVVCAALALRPSAYPLALRFGALPPARRTLLALGTIIGVASFGLVLRELSPTLFARWSREEGVWEPLTLVAYAAGAFALLGAARLSDPAERRHLRLLAAPYALLALEEVDYLGIFGGFIGRIDGIYVGSPHDLLRLWKHGALPPYAAAALVVLALAAAWLLWRREYLQPARILRVLASPAAAWLWLGGALLALGTFDDAEIFRLLATGPALEELLELTGVLCLLVFALETAGRRVLPLQPRAQNV